MTERSEIGGEGTGTGTAAITVGGNTANTTATNAAVIMSAHYHALNVPAESLTNVVAALDPVANGALTIAAQPPIPCKLQVRIVDANASISAGTVDLVGVGTSGQALTQSIPLTGGTQTVTTTDAYASLTSATVASVAGAAAGDTIGIGTSAAIGLPATKTPTPASFAVYKANVDGAAETVGTVDATAGTITPTTAPNGTRDFDFWYTYSATPTQSAHQHAATGLTATDAGHSHS